DAESVAREQQTLCAKIEPGKAPHPIQLLECFLAPNPQPPSKHFGVGPGTKRYSPPLEFLAQFQIVVYLTVENNCAAAVRKKHWLLSGNSKVEDRKTYMSKSHSETADCGDFNAVPVRTPMLLGCTHCQEFPDQAFVGMG